MNPHPHQEPAKRILPFHEWMELAYPRASAMRTFLKAIGVMDVHYLLYRLGYTTVKEKATHTSDPVRRAIQKTATVKAPVAEPTKTVTKQVKKPAKPKKAKAILPPKELTMEFTEKHLPKEELKPEPAPVEVIEPEPLVLNDEPVAEPTPEPEPKKHDASTTYWLDDAALENEDLLKTKKKLSIDGITIALKFADNNGEQEAVVFVGHKTFRAQDPGTQMNLSAVLQKARVDSGELYVFGSTAFGAITGKGYVTATELQRVIHLLNDSESKTVDVHIEYFDADSSSRTRKQNTLDIRFERVQ